MFVTLVNNSLGSGEGFITELLTLVVMLLE